MVSAGQAPDQIEAQSLITVPPLCWGAGVLVAGWVWPCCGFGFWPPPCWTGLDEDMTAPLVILVFLVTSCLRLLSGGIKAARCQKDELPRNPWATGNKIP